MATKPAAAKTAKKVAPKADQPKVSTASLKTQSSPPGLTYKTTGVKKASGGKTQRNYAKA